MRRKDKAFLDAEGIGQTLDSATWGVLGLAAPAGPPVMVPLNFVRIDDTLFIHSAQEGEKMTRVRAGAEASFLVVDALAVVPSYAFDPDRACKATQYYTSVLLHGRVEEVREPARKAAALQALMVKLQPEGGHRPIEAGDPLYRAGVDAVAILAFHIDRASAKRELGGRLTPDQRQAVAATLVQRGAPKDLETAQRLAGPGSPGPSGAGPGAGPAS